MNVPRLIIRILLPRICCSKDGKFEDASLTNEEILRLLSKLDSFDDSLLLLFQLNGFLGLAVGADVVETGIFSQAVSICDCVGDFSYPCLSFTNTFS